MGKCEVGMVDGIVLLYGLMLRHTFSFDYVGECVEKFEDVAALEILFYGKAAPLMEVGLELKEVLVNWFADTSGWSYVMSNEDLTNVSCVDGVSLFKFGEMFCDVAGDVDEEMKELPIQ